MNSTTQRAISHSWVLRESEFYTNSSNSSPENISCMTNHDQLCYTIQPTSTNTYSGLETASYQPVNQSASKSSPIPLPYVDFSTNGILFSSVDKPEPQILNLENASKNCETIGFGGQQQSFDNFMINHYLENEVGNAGTGGFTSSLPVTAAGADEWRPNMAWDSPPCQSASSTYSTNKCHM